MDNQQLKFSRTQHEDHLFIDRNQSGVLIGMTGGWSIGLAPNVASRYANSPGTYDNGGFIGTGDGTFVLAHGAARLLLSCSEADAIRQLIKTSSWYQLSA